MLKSPDRARGLKSSDAVDLRSRCPPVYVLEEGLLETIPSRACRLQRRGRSMMPSEISRSEKDKDHMLSLICGI